MGIQEGGRARISRNGPNTKLAEDQVVDNWSLVARRPILMFWMNEWCVVLAQPPGLLASWPRSCGLLRHLCEKEKHIMARRVKDKEVLI